MGRGSNIPVPLCLQSPTATAILGVEQVEERLAVHLRIHGRVQGVGYRYWTVGEALARGLDGWVRNLPDGTVEVLVSGPSDAVDAMVVACRKGPAFASVRSIRKFPADAPDTPGFRQVS